MFFFFLSFFRRASSILHELFMVVYTQNSSILFWAVHNPVAFHNFEVSQGARSHSLKNYGFQFGTPFSLFVHADAHLKISRSNPSLQTDSTRIQSTECCLFVWNAVIFCLLQVGQVTNYIVHSFIHLFTQQRHEIITQDRWIRNTVSVCTWAWDRRTGVCIVFSIERGTWKDWCRSLL